jgi:hypothetical protein
MDERAFELRKEASAAPQPEPVAWMFQHDETGRTALEYHPDDSDAFERNNPRWRRVVALYRQAPDQSARIAELEGLLRECLTSIDRVNDWELQERIEAELKEGK